MTLAVAETRLWLFATVMSLGGCTPAGAPSFELFGAFFPAWMLCATIGIVAGILARAVFVATRLTDVLPYQLVVCTAIGAIFAISVSLLVFER
jgi:YtcA family